MQINFNRGVIMMKILLAEDEKELSNALVMLLEHNNYIVDAVYDGEDAFSYAQEVDYDIIILDVMMPKLNGYQVLSKLREKNCKAPILMLTAKSHVDDKVTGLELGADDYLTKPFEMKELLARIKALLRRPAEFNSDILEFGDIFLDRNTYKLVCKKQEAVLNKKEFQTMELLILNSKQILSKDLIMDKIWGYESDAEINVVWVNISSLRKKLLKLNSKVNIASIRGLGYRIEVDCD